MDFIRDVVTWFGDASHWWGPDGVLQRLQDHVGMSAVAVAVGMVLALPVALWMGHTGRGGGAVIAVSNLGRAIPSFAIIVLAAQAFGIGAKPAFIALVALAVPPMVTNTYTAVRGVDGDVRESAVGMGLTGGQVLWKVEVPMGLPLIMAGVRTSAVQVVATATLAALVGWGGLGRYIIDGLATRDFVEVFAGASMVALLSLVTELGLGLLQRVVVPKGLHGDALADVDHDLAALPGVAPAASGRTA